MRPDASRFKLWHEVDVRFKDIDVGGHAHHSVALVYFEEARARYWLEVVGKGALAQVDFILAEARLRYHARVLYPRRLSVGARVSVVGRKHFVMEYLVRDALGVDLVSGETTLVMYDYAKGSSKAVPAAVREAIADWEGPPAPSSASSTES
jgi:acyl-CoA thioester hydrolase